ncbi:hypothetical protein VUJ46_08220 [Chryseobacterium sp. MYb264]|uniref:hypothetical protein n=1 Tax=Chryseobacterium sp. MYb264 TaxID=2745153 RepID=UPI002E1347B5|nr:hypothetical protein VUJ46_08220 [Chryseobacterium sp. MYb264]
MVKDKKFSAGDMLIFDMNTTLGGRLESVIMPRMDFWEELRGMRYLTSQEIVTTLTEDYPSLENPKNEFL